MAAVLTAVRTVRGWHAPLAWFAASMVLLTAVTGVAWLVDDRVLGGMPIWAKPMKFALSFTAYALTLAWMTSRLQRWRRTGWWAGTVLVAASVGEMLIIVGQVVRGRQSHFNIATPLDGALFSAMGMLVAVIYLATVVVGAALLRAPTGDAALTWALRLGLVIAVAGLSVGFLMVGQPPAGAHAVGVADGGPGLPLLGWSTTGGDLRVGHFVGMHALQALPLLALALASPRGGGLGERTRLRVVLLAGAAYGGAVALAVWQALRGQPLLAPDAATLVGAAALALGVAVAAGLVARGHRAEPVAAPTAAAALR